MWILVTFTLFAIVVWVVALIHGASMIAGERRGLFDPPREDHERQDRDVA